VVRLFATGADAGIVSSEHSDDSDGTAAEKDSDATESTANGISEADATSVSDGDDAGTSAESVPGGGVDKSSARLMMGQLQEAKAAGNMIEAMASFAAMKAAGHVNYRAIADLMYMNISTTNTKLSKQEFKNVKLLLDEAEEADIGLNLKSKHLMSNMLDRLARYQSNPICMDLAMKMKLAFEPKDAETFNRCFTPHHRRPLGLISRGARVECGRWHEVE
jgi:hypothetical protein